MGRGAIFLMLFQPKKKLSTHRKIFRRAKLPTRTQNSSQNSWRNSPRNPTLFGPRLYKPYLLEMHHTVPVAKVGLYKLSISLFPPYFANCTFACCSWFMLVETSTEHGCFKNMLTASLGDRVLLLLFLYLMLL